MTSERIYLKNIKPYSNIHVIFGDCAKGNFFGKGQMYYPGLPCLNDDFLGDGLDVNIISFIQLCDQ